MIAVQLAAVGFYGRECWSAGCLWDRFCARMDARPALCARSLITRLQVNNLNPVILLKAVASALKHPCPPHSQITAGGPEVAKFCALYIRDEVESAPEFKDGKFGQSLTNAFHRMDERMRSAEGLAQLDTIRRSLEKSALVEG